MSAGGEQNKSEEATPHKLVRARERGQVARSGETGFVAGMLVLSGMLLVGGEGLAADFAGLMRRSLSVGMDQASFSGGMLQLLAELYWTALEPVLLFGAAVVGVVLTMEIVQLRGLMFTAHPLKPDFTRLNPATGLKRLFTARMFKEILKTLAKALVYGWATWLTIRYTLDQQGLAAMNGGALAGILRDAALRLLFVFVAIAIGFALLDQVMVRREFAKQMRMSRSEVTREHKEREGEPRLRAKRKQLHAEFARNARGEQQLAGSDLLIVNPEHFAVALRYRGDEMTAPLITTKGRNLHALRLKRRAAELGIAVIAKPELARALYRECPTGREIPASHFEGVAALYNQLAARGSEPTA